MGSSILDIEVSCFANYNTPSNPKPVNLLRWLLSDKYKNEIEKLRAVINKSERDKLKAMLPAITPGGLFTYRKEENLIRYSGFIQFDIDLKENKNISNYAELKEQLSHIKNVAYCGLSASGLGYWGLIPIAYPERQKEHFKALEMALRQYGVIIDQAPKSIVSLRGYSYDENGYFNHNAEILKATYVAGSSIYSKPKPIPRQIGIGNITQVKVEKFVKCILSSRVDITGTYKQWIQVGFAFANEFGELGRQYFHAISGVSSKYDYNVTDRQYSHCLKSNGNGVTIGTFFYYCKQYGIKE